MLYLILSSVHRCSKLLSLTVNTKLILHTVILKVKQASFTQYCIIIVFSVAMSPLILDAFYLLFSTAVLCLLFAAATDHYDSQQNSADTSQDY